VKPRAASSMAELWTFNRRCGEQLPVRYAGELRKLSIAISIVDANRSVAAPLTVGRLVTIAD
jgi:hypothetical protein